MKGGTSPGGYCSCGLRNINTFDYFTDILNKEVTLASNVADDILRELLSDKWFNLNE